MPGRPLTAQEDAAYLARLADMQSEGVPPIQLDRGAAPQTLEQQIIDRIASTEARAATKEIGAGNLPPESTSDSIIGALIQGALSGVTAGGSEGVASRVFGVNTFDPNAPRQASPNTYALAETLGGLLPIGRLAKGAGTAVQALKQIGGVAPSTLGLAVRGAGAGAGYGFASGASQKAENPEATLEESLQAGVAPAVVGGALGAGIPLIAPVAKGAFSLVKGFGPKQAEDVLANVAKFTERGLSETKRSVEGNYGKLLPEIMYYAGERTSGRSAAEQFTEGVVKAITERERTYAPLLTTGRPETIIKHFTAYPENAEKYVRDQILKKNPSYDDRQVESLISGVKGTIDKTTNSNIISINKDINKRVSTIYDSEGVTTLNPSQKEVFGYLRDYNSNKVIKPIIKENNINPDVYTDTGKLGDILNAVEEEYLQASGKQQAARGATLGETVAEPLLTGKGLQAATAGVIQKAGQGVLKGRQGYIDRQMDSIFSKVSPEAPSFQQSYPYFPPQGGAAGIPTLQMSPVQPPTPLSVPALPSVATPSLEDQIQLIIQTLPRDIKGLPDAIQRDIALQVIEGNARRAPRALTGEIINRTPAP